MKKQRYIVKIEMPDGDFISAGWLKDLIQTDCDVEDEIRKKVTVQETSLPSNLDEAAEKYSENILANNEDLQDAIEDAFKAGAEWMAGQFQQEQPEVDLEKEFAHEYAIYHLPNFIIASLVDGTELIDFIYKTASHFYSLGLNARKEEKK